MNSYLRYNDKNYYINESQIQNTSIKNNGNKNVLLCNH